MGWFLARFFLALCILVATIYLVAGIVPAL